MPDEDTILLLIEDNPTDLDLIAHALRKFHFTERLVIVRDGEEALDYLFGRGQYHKLPPPKPRLIITDIRLPKIPGLDVIRQIKADPKTRAIPVVVLSGSDAESDIVQSYHFGANSYIVKPNEYDKFIEIVRLIGLYWLGINTISSGSIEGADT